MCLHSSPETACLCRNMTDETSGELPSRAEVRVPWAVSPNAMLAWGKLLKISVKQVRYYLITISVLYTS